MAKQASKTNSTTKAKPDKSIPAAKRTRAAPSPDQPKESVSARLTELMRAEGGMSAADLAQAVGWQKHSVRGFIAGTLKKRADVEVLTVKMDGVTRYQLRDRASA